MKVADNGSSKAQSILVIPKDAMILIAQKLDIPLATVYGVVTFYSFSNQPKEKTISKSVLERLVLFVRQIRFFAIWKIVLELNVVRLVKI